MPCQRVSPALHLSVIMTHKNLKDLESLPDEEFQNLSRLQSIVGQEAEKLGILFIEAKKFQVDGQNLWNAEPQAVAQSIAAYVNQYLLNLFSGWLNKILICSLMQIKYFPSKQLKLP